MISNLGRRKLSLEAIPSQAGVRIRTVDPEKSHDILFGQNKRRGLCRPVGCRWKIDRASLHGLKRRNFFFNSRLPLSRIFLVRLRQMMIRVYATRHEALMTDLIAVLHTAEKNVEAESMRPHVLVSPPKPAVSLVIHISFPYPARALHVRSRRCGLQSHSQQEPSYLRRCRLAVQWLAGV